MSYPGGGGQWNQHGQYVDPITGEQGQYTSGPAQYGGAFGGSFGQGSVYSGGLYPGSQPPKRPTAAIVGAVVAVLVVLAGLGTGGYFLLSGSDSDDEPATADESPTVSAPADEHAEPTGEDAPDTGETDPEPGDQNVEIDPVTEGWQGVYSPKDGIAYDVPKDNWDVESSGVVSGFEPDNGDTVLARGVSNYHKDYCKEDPDGLWRHGMVGTQSAGESDDPGNLARAAVVLWGGAIAEVDQDPEAVDSSEPEEVDVTGGRTAYVSSAEVDASYDEGDPEECQADKSKVTVAAFEPPDDDKVRILIIVNNIDVDDALSDSDIDQIIESVRPHSD